MKTTLTLCTLLYTTFLFSQDTTRWKIGVHFSPDLCYRILTANDNEEATASAIENGNFIESPIFGLTTGVTGTYAFNERVELETGVFFSRKGYQWGKVYYVSSLGPSGVVYSYIRRKMVYQGLDVPLRVNLSFGSGSWKFTGTAGLCANFFIEERIKSDFHTQGSTHEAETLKWNDTYAPVMLSGEIGFGVTKALGERFSLRTVPMFRYVFLHDDPTDHITTHLWSAGVNVGGYFNF